MHIDIDEELAAELVLPTGGGARPGLIVLHEWWGLNEEMRALCARFAAEGMLALGLDLYRGQSTADPNRAAQLSNDLKTMVSMKDVAQGLAYLRSHPRCTGKIGITGFCLGGALSLAAACNVEGLAAVAPFYGIPRADCADWSKVRAPIQMHFGRRDPQIAVERAEAVHDALAGAGKRVELHVYDAGHAFMRKSDAAAYDEAAASLAWERLMSFLRTELA